MLGNPMLEMGIHPTEGWPLATGFTCLFEGVVGKFSVITVGVVHANAGQNVTPHNPSLGLFLCHFFTYSEVVTSRVNPQQHKQPTNTTTMVMAPLAPLAAWI